MSKRWMAWGVLALVGCTENKFTQLTRQDVFQQNRLNAVDVLLVVDNSCSMAEEQNKLAANFGSFIQYFESANVDWQIGVVTTDVFAESQAGQIQGGDDELLLLDAEGREKDALAYDASWGIAEGQVWSLDMSWASVSGNDRASAWCASDAGTPGAANPSGCAATAGSGPDTRLGSVILTEFAPDPAGVADALGEWVEISNIGAEDVDLTGWALADRGRNRYDLPSGTILPAGGQLVLGRSADPSANGGVPVDLEVGADFTLNNNTRLLSRTQAGAEEIFSEQVAQGVTGTGWEMGLEAARLALSEPAISTTNAGLLREDANLAIIVVSDEQDSSPDRVDTYLNDLAGLKGEDAWRNHQRMSVSAVVGSTPPPFPGDPSCESSNGVASYGSRYVYAAAQTSGLVESICDEDFSPLATDLGLTLSGLQVEFELSEVPVVSTLSVSLYSSPDSDDKIRDLTLDVDYTYIEERNVLRFEYDQIPESEIYIVASYTLQSGT